MTRIIIVGGGIAGLYIAYRLQSSFDDIHLYEATDRIGGRILERRFENFNVSMGASMIRLTDNNVVRLCRHLGLELKIIDATMYSQETEFVNATIEKIINKYNPRTPLNMSVREFLFANFTRDEAEKYIEYSIYRDYLDSSIHEYLFRYPITDHLQIPTEGFIVKGGYYRMVDALYENIRGKVTIHLNTPVTRVTDNYIILANQTRKRYDKLYWTVTATNKDIVNRVLQYTPLNEIYGVPFLTMYGLVDSAHKYPSVVVGGLLGKMYPLSKNILMVGYTDNIYAQKLYAELKDMSEEKTIEYVQGLVRQIPKFEDVTIRKIIYQYWLVGIHQNRTYMENIKLRHGNIHLIGEAVSTNQGWVAGAIASVNTHFNR